MHNFISKSRIFTIQLDHLVQYFKVGVPTISGLRIDETGSQKHLRVIHIAFKTLRKGREKYCLSHEKISLIQRDRK
jgi:hypothetical protein